MGSIRYKIDEEKKEKEYSHFLNAFLSFQLSLLKSLKSHHDESGLRYQLEKSLARSLSKIWTMCVLIFSLNSLHQKITDKKTLYYSHPDSFLPLLEKIKSTIEQHSFVQELDKLLCLNFVEQIMTYYCDDNGTTVTTSNDQCKPWYSIKEISQWEK